MVTENRPAADLLIASQDASTIKVILSPIAAPPPDSRHDRAFGTAAIVAGSGRGSGIAVTCLRRRQRRVAL